jgi:hypothetical protein
MLVCALELIPKEKGNNLRKSIDLLQLKGLKEDNKPGSLE